MPNVTVSTNVDTLLKSANNAAMRSNLGLGDAATKNTGIAAGTVAAGDDSRITGALQTSGGTMTGKLEIQATDTAAALRVTQLGTGEALRVEDEANPDATAFVVSSTGKVGIGVTPDATAALAVDSNGISFPNGIQDRAMDFGANTRTVGVDGATIQACINSITTASSTNQFQVLIPPGTYTENLTLKPCVSLAGTGANNGQTPISRIVGQHTFTGTATAADNIIQLSSLRFDNSSASNTFVLNASGSVPVLVQFDSCTIFTSNASTSTYGVVVNANVVVQANDVKSLCNATAGSGGTHFALSGGSLYATNLSTEFGTCAILMTGTNGANKPYCELKNCDIRAVGANLVNITSNTALFTAGWCSFSNSATSAKGFNIATGSVVGVYNSSYTVTAGASNYLVDGSAGSYYFSALNNYSNSSLVAYETKIGASVTQVPYTTNMIPVANGGTGQTSYTNGQLLIGNASGGLTKATLTAGSNVTITNGDGAITIAATGGAAGVSSFSAGTTGLTPNTGTTGAVTLAGTLGVANGGTGQTTANAALNTLLPSQSGNSGKVLSTDGTNTSWVTGGSATPVDRQVFTSTGSWTKPAGAKYIEVTLIGGGGAGAPGSRRVVTPTSALMQGGTGGASGSVVKAQFAASDITNTVAITIPINAPKAYPGYLCNSWNIFQGTVGSTPTFGAFTKIPAAAGRGNMSYFNGFQTGGTSAGFDSNAGGAPGGVAATSARGSSGGTGGLNTGAGAGAVNSTFGFGSLSTPPIAAQPSVTANFTSPLPAPPMHGTGSFGDNQSSGGASGMSIANTLCLGGSAADGGGWFPPVNLTSVATTSGSPTVTCASTVGLNVGMAIIPSSGFANPTNRLLYVSSITNSTTFVVSSNANATTSGQTALATCGYGGGGGGGGSAQASTPILITGVNLTSGSTTVDCTSTRGVLVGLTIFNNANIPAGTTVASLVNETQFTISAAATGTETAGKLVVAGVGTISGFSTTNGSLSASVTSTLGMTWGQALWASNGITPGTSDNGYRHVDAVTSATAFLMSTTASATTSGLTLYAMNCIGFIGGANTTSGSNIITVSDTTPLYVGMMVTIVSAANTWSTTSGSTSATSTNPIPATVSAVSILGDGVSSNTLTTLAASAGGTSLTLSSTAIATVTNKTFYYTSPTDAIVFPTPSGSKNSMSYARIISIDSATQITVDTNALATVAGQTLAYAFTGGAGGNGGGSAVEVVTYF